MRHADEPQTVTAAVLPGDTADDYRDRQMRVLMALARTQTAQMAEMVVAQRDVSRRLDRGAERMDLLDHAIKQHAIDAAASAARTEGRIEELASASAARGEAIDKRLDAMALELAANTRDTREAKIITQDIAERRTWWRGAKERLARVRWWILGITTTLAAILALIWEVLKFTGRGGGGGSGGVGPVP